MYLGKVVELADRSDLYERPLHPYTHALLSAVPVPDPEVEARRDRIILRGEIPSPTSPPSGCRFHTRCWLRTRLGEPENCATAEPELRPMGTNHQVACHWVEELPHTLIKDAVPSAA
jgi:peptide/nickel transport system ATP-binding protein